MTTQEKINKIRSECIKVNPEILKLKFGCKVKPKVKFEYPQYVFSEDFIFINHSGGGQIADTGDFEEYNLFLVENETKEIYQTDDYIYDEFEIIGRDIRLADVLYILSERYKFQSKPQCIAFNGGFYDNGVLLATYNLLDDNIEHQSEECIDFIYNLIEN